MAKILFSVHSNIIWDTQNPLAIDAFYAGFLAELKKLGHEVMVIRTNTVIDIDFALNKTSPRRAAYVDTAVRVFNPDLIITGNNSVPQAALDATTCPIVILTSDSPSYFSGQDYIKENIDRYFFAHHTPYMSFPKVCCQQFGAKSERNVFVGYATGIYKQDLPMTQNILFIGTLGWPETIRNKFSHIKSEFELKKFWETFNAKTTLPEEFDNNYLHILTANHRIQTLNALHDLGLKCHGFTQNFAEALAFSVDLVKCFDIKVIYTIEEQQKALNSSKIAPNLSNAQAVDGFSWRVADIMASNACLIAPPQKGLMEISPYIKIPTYTSPSEARELCIRLLKDEVWRKEIVEGSQKSIDENYRYLHLIKRLEKALPFTLTQEEAEGVEDWSLTEHFDSPESQTHTHRIRKYWRETRRSHVSDGWTWLLSVTNVDDYKVLICFGRIFKLFPLRRKNDNSKA